MNLKKINSKKKNPNGKWTVDLSKHLSNEDILMATKHMKRYSTPVTIRKMQIKPESESFYSN